MKSCRHIVPDHNRKELYLVGSINASQVTLTGHLGVAAEASRDDKDSEAVAVQAAVNISRANSTRTPGRPARRVMAAGVPSIEALLKVCVGPIIIPIAETKQGKFIL